MTHQSNAPDPAPPVPVASTSESHWAGPGAGGTAPVGDDNDSGLSHQVPGAGHTLSSLDLALTDPTLQPGS